jgi:transketolase
MHTLKPLDHAALLAAARETHGLITVEEHTIFGGLGGAVAEVISEHALAPVRRIGINDVFCEYVGSQQELLEIYGITSDRIVEVALQLLFKKLPFVKHAVRTA